MLFEFKCKCGYVDEYFFTYSKVKSPNCPDCGGVMQRVFTPPVIRSNGIRRVPEGMAELGTEYPGTPTQKDHMDGVEKVMHEVIESGVDLDGSGDYELQRLTT